MIDAVTLAQRVEQLEAQYTELLQLLADINERQEKILENDVKLFEIHEHNDQWLKQVYDRQAELETLFRETG